MLVKKKDTQVFRKNGCTVYEYGGTKNLDIGTAEIETKYPIRGWARNKKVDETYFILSGGGKVYIGDEVYKVEKDDLVMIEKGKWYRAEGEMRVLMACSPAWSSKQH